MSIADIRRQAAHSGDVVRRLEIWRLKYERENGRKPDGYWHPSSIAGCPTAAVYEQLGFPQPSVPHDARLLRIFDTGTALHGMLQTQFCAAGVVPKIPWPVDVKDKQGNIIVKKGEQRYAIEVPVLDEKYKLAGTLDILFELALISTGELKTKHSSSFAKMTVADPKHVAQVTCYHWKAMEMGFVNDERATILYYSKDDSHMREFREPITDQRINDTKNKLDLMNNMVEGFRVHYNVPDPYYKESQKPPCRTCPWANACHATLHREAWINKIKALRDKSNEPTSQTASQSPGQVRRVPVRINK